MESINVDDPKLSNNSKKSTAARDFPSAFYCPITGKIMANPVVLKSDGHSYERQAILNRVDPPSSDDLYPNRALLSIIEERLAERRSLLKRVQVSMRSTMSLLTETATNSVSSSRRQSLATMLPRPLPEAYYCPITFGILHDPVITPDGITYERAAIVNWIRVKGTSPTTREAASVDSLVANHAIGELLEAEKSKSDDSIHPSIRKWKQEKTPEVSDKEVGGEFQEGNCCDIFICLFLVLMVPFGLALLIVGSVVVLVWAVLMECINPSDPMEDDQVNETGGDD